jgi:Transposase
MDQPSIIGVDLAKTVFQVHGVSADGTAMLRRQLRRGQVLAFFSRLEPCLIGMEACSGAHHWARELAALGHEVRLMPASYVKPYVKRGKTDRADAEAICEAVSRPTMRFVPVKSAEVQAALLDHKARDFLIRQQTQTVNAIRAHLAEFGIVVAKGIHNVDRLLASVEQAPEAARPALELVADQLRDLRDRIETVTKRIEVAQKTDPLPDVSPRSPASDRSPRAPSPSPRRMSRRSALRGTIPPGSASRRSPIRAAARSGSGGSRRPETDTCGGCSISERWRKLQLGAADEPGPTGSGRCWSESP